MYCDDIICTLYIDRCRGPANSVFGQAAKDNFRLSRMGDWAKRDTKLIVEATDDTKEAYR
jgi:hypothetical protein